MGSGGFIYRAFERTMLASAVSSAFTPSVAVTDDKNAASCLSDDFLQLL
jgi:hypothetical protein